ncbi:hypothetical protein FHR83_004040 [Actinoplanes campanulatus]|uniref:Uncharacterized protein n=1 Tax=Actinoplanes campanulatus TaxID=113559 RepID=A0A7W5FFG9_9ACTN|nr:hypothetical protein [Actinoplanes campanulatus]MBB3096370.1 hypothetical protein [Actinoplanes campanulatus]GGN18726.1 hypothetical protein GCM10010109_32000 [Actinoplanes campanulatus]GID38436.1 hypothetical protein Aca09nite_49420 [Actinoplanes campanulatus]
MSTNEPQSGLPVEFLHAVVAGASADSPQTGMAVERLRSMADGTVRDGLILALLRGALKDSAPVWMLEAAIERDLKTDKDQGYGYSRLESATTALAHPSCPAAMRAQTLSDCSANQLGVFGRSTSAEVLTEAVVTELQRRCTQPLEMTVDLLENPGPAQAVLRDPALHDVVFSAAVVLLPAHPKFKEQDDFEAWIGHSKAWRLMWERLLAVHSSRHRWLVEWARGTKTYSTIRESLLSELPWTVDPLLLEELAADDLTEFPKHALLTRMHRLKRDGATTEQTLAAFDAEMNGLDPDARDFVTELLELSEYGADAAVRWVSRAVDKTWRHILSPAQAKSRFGEAHTWQASDELLSKLGRRFAEAAVEALELWEPSSDGGADRVRELRWVHVLLLHLPEVTAEVEQRVRDVLKANPRYHRISWHEDERRAAELRAAIERILGDLDGPDRSSALGDPGRVTVRELAGTSEDVLEDYLQRHAGDELIEKALLSFSHHARYRLTFASVLGRHSQPDEALLRLTLGLRRHVGGGPSNRENWTRAVLSLPDCDSAVIRALPAWSAMTVGGSNGYRPSHERVVSLVTTALRDDADAWTRFAGGPASYSGPTAWLRLGDILDAAVGGGAWPDPPAPK